MPAHDFKLHDEKGRWAALAEALKGADQELLRELVATVESAQGAGENYRDGIDELYGHLRDQVQGVAWEAR